MTTCSNISNLSDQMVKKISEIALYEILQLKINFNQYNPINVGVSTYVPLPKFIQNKKGVLNIENNDEYCFLWSIVAALNPCNNRKNPNRTSSYPHFSEVLNYDDIDFPIKLKDIPKFEQLNNISVNVFTCEKKEVVPVCLSKFEFLTTINLLFTERIRNYNAIYHFALIKNMSRLLCGQQTSDLAHSKFYCDRCLNHSYSQQNLNNHIFTCRKMNKTKISLPQNDCDKFIKFLNYKHKEKVPFVIYADIESILEKFACIRAGSDIY
ncbi:uncharacterized protein LOC126266582 [Aethina tumida]|uniref:uncharacterized protein LOC126266582 n=1 Tax=Aethina tumida TaxID=116153 RepID=UPI0021477212|nr:uncharacterized protein LOC126266582 [Aethina tumida]